MVTGRDMLMENLYQCELAYNRHRGKHFDFFEYTGFINDQCGARITKECHEWGVKAIESDMSISDNINDLVLDGGMTVAEKVLEQTGVIGEKIEVSAHIVEGVQVSSYVHAGNRLATLVGFNNKADEQVAKDVAMQVAAMNPLSVDKDGIDQVTIDRELEIAKDLARQEGKPEAMLEKIAMGRLNKFYKENTLLNQGFIKESKKTVSQYLKEQNGELSVTCFKRIGLGN